MKVYVNFYITNLRSAIGLLNYKVREFTLLESISFRNKFYEKFVRGEPNWPLWERFLDDFAIRDRDAWKLLDEFIQGQEVFFFFEEQDEPIVFQIDKNQSIVKLLDGGIVAR